MLCSIVHKNIGGKWEAILAQIFVVGGRFQPYPAMPPSQVLHSPPLHRGEQGKPVQVHYRC